MATMLNGAAVMDAALLLISGNETCPQPQTSEHLAAIEIMKLNHIIILQNKVDLMREEGAETHYQSILKFIRGTVADGSPIIPISAQLKYNIDVRKDDRQTHCCGCRHAVISHSCCVLLAAVLQVICEYICKKIPVPVRDFSGSPQLIVI